ncbi:3-ketoacyl-ACP reductase [Thermogymnomonas acidicola]|uniref:3-ketoacyl-ACP reductase n=1 Tax=Thermogymnomonas acidicola TaxID=399579 RepID=A0AA37BRZ1_9ARCH|nr:glucose 1-dehydrogenase [Thermogymnomonas acidicola]GGM75752.1 3-ketoacyl-ACP reductase [Thermogymnomonas acidicola]
MPGILDGRVALVTGSGRGIGRAVAEALAAAGARVAVNYSRDREGAVETAERVGGRAYHADVSKREDVHRMAEEIHRDLGKVSILVNNAGVLYPMDLEHYDDKLMWRMVGVNMMGPVYTVLEFLDDLRSSEGCVVNIASNAGIGTAAPGTTFYAMTKAAVIAFTKRLAFDLSGTGVRVNCIAPGWVETDMTVGGRSQEEVEATREHFRSRTTLRRTGRPEDIASVVLFLASGASSYMNGQVIVVDGGRVDNLSHSV